MAFYNEKDDQDEEILQEGQAPTVGPGSSTISTSQGASSLEQQAPAAAASAPSSRGSSPNTFAGIQDYLKANQSQAAKLGEQVAGNITNTIGTARGDITGLQTEAESKIKPVGQLDQSVFNQIGTGAETLTQEQRDLIKGTAGAQYTGPQDYTQLGDAYTKAAGSAKKAQDVVKNVGTEQGRADILREMSGGKTTAGINAFDAALLSSGGGRERLQSAAEAGKDVGDVFNTTLEGITSRIGRQDDPTTTDIDESAGAIGQTQAESARAKAAIQNAMKAWTEGFNPKVQTAQNDLVSLQNRVLQDLGGSDRFALTPETMALLGLNQGDKLYNVDLNKFIQQASPGDINAANVASAEDYARYLALSDLSGETPSILQAGNESLAGTAPTVSANRTELQKALAAAKDPYLDMLYSTTQLPALTADNSLRSNSYNGISASAGTVLTPRQLDAAIKDFESNILANASGTKTRNELTRRLNNAKQLLSNWVSGTVGTGGLTAIKKQQ